MFLCRRHAGRARIVNRLVPLVLFRREAVDWAGVVRVQLGVKSDRKLMLLVFLAVLMLLATLAMLATFDFGGFKKCGFIGLFGKVAKVANIANNFMLGGVATFEIGRASCRERV